MKLSNLEVMVNGTCCPFFYRAESAGDKGVIEQIFQHEDYSLARWVQGKRLMDYHDRQSKLRPSLVVDAGANIGASAVYFLNSLDNCFVFAIEPDVDNWNLLEINTATYDNKINFLGAIANFDGEMILEDPGLSDWGYRTTPANHSPRAHGPLVKTISPDRILASPFAVDKTPLILKVDIEGAEATLFEGGTPWMDVFPLIIIELHDWMLPFTGSSRNFLRAVAQYEFDFVYRGENIFLFNRKILSDDWRPTHNG